MCDFKMVLPTKTFARKLVAVARADCALPGSSLDHMFDQAHAIV